MKKCKYEGCNNKFLARNMCSTHYNQEKKLGLFSKAKTTYEWIIEHADYQGDDCLIWPYARTKAGYPNMKHGDQYRVASRVMCEVAHGMPENEELQAAHSCGNGMGGCMNPKHLRWATREENEADKEIHGTRYRGEDCSFAKLSWAIVDAVRHDAKTMRNKDLAEKYGLARQTISNITLNQRWVR